MSCKTCKEDIKDCTCGPNGIHVSPPSECNTPECPTPEPCSEITPTTCITYVGDNKTCGGDTVYEDGDSLAEVNSKIVDYFCGQLGAATIIVTEKSCDEDTVYETGDTIIEALDKTVDYFCEAVSGITLTMCIKYAGDWDFITNVPLVVTHNMGTDDFTVQLKDATGNLISPSSVNTYTATQVTITITTTETCRVIIVG